MTYRDDRDALIEQAEALRREMQVAVAASGVLVAERDAQKVEIDALRAQVQSLLRSKRDGDATRGEMQELAAERDGLKAEVESLRRELRSSAWVRAGDETARRHARQHEARAIYLSQALAAERARVQPGIGVYAVTTLVGAAVASFGWMIAWL